MNSARARSSLGLILWHLAGLLATVGIVSQVLMGRSITEMRTEHLVFLSTLAFAFALSAGANIWWLQRHPTSYSVVTAALLPLAAFSLAALVLVLLQSPVSRPVLVASIALTMAVMCLARWMPTLWLVTGAVALLGLGIGVQAFMGRIVDVEPEPLRGASVVNTRYVSLRATYYENYFANCRTPTGECDYTPRIGGAISRLGEGYLLATGEGLVYFFTRAGRGALNVSQLPYQVPLNDADFATSGESQARLRLFRVTDILVDERGGEASVYATHHYYYKPADCVVLRLSRLRGPAADIARGTAPDRWDTVYETKPCLPRHPGPRLPIFFGEESGGRLARLDSDTLLMTVGDHNFNGWNSENLAAQDLASDYGKILAIDTDRRVSTVFTFGHRNPQGLFVTSSGTIWSTEHGPSGGDELNRVVRGANYGWPLVSYGTEYGERIWPVSATPNEHRGFEEPVYSWVPSIAVSNLIVLEKDRFPYWQGDLLIGSYLQSLFRARVRGGRVVTLEPIPLQSPSRRARIRDLFEDRDGTIVVLFDLGTVAFVEPEESSARPAAQAQNVQGRTLFAACAGCHEVGDGTTHRIGPDLAGIVNRRVADRNGFAYSRALSSRGGRWTEENLHRFLADPQAFVPGNGMATSGIPDREDRALLIAYLKESASRRGQ